MGRTTWALALGALLAACSGSDGSAIGGGDGGSGPSDAGTTSETSAGATYTLDNVCDLTASKICELRKPCCEKTFGYDEAACLANAKNDCAKDVADTKAGLMTFHPERIDPCISKFEPLLDACFSTVEILYQAFAVAECRVFEGQTAAGAQCTRDSQCQPAGDSSTLVDCTAKDVCKYTSLLQAGATCSWGDNAPGYCARGLYCSAPLGGGASGECKTATKLGVACNTAVAISTECGLGAYCDKDSAKCAAAKGLGASCATAFECQSLKCESSGTSGGKSCQQADPIVHAEECK